MKSSRTPSFRKLFSALPSEIREQARAAYKLFRANPRHPGLNFKRVHGSQRLVSVRVTGSYRAVGVLRTADHVLWFWIGPHEEYEKILSMR